MKQTHIKRLAMVSAFAAVIVLAAMSVSATDQDAMPDTKQHPGMTMPMEKDGMMAMHEAMQAKMQALDQKLDALVLDMNSAGAVAAVVAELVGQRKAMHGMMMKMGPKMMGHMMEHMGSGMTEGMKQSMGECPMMKQMSSADEQAAAEDHSAHHPEG